MTKLELVQFLSTVDKKHIDELVDLLTDNGDGRMVLNSTVKDVLLWEKSSSTKYNFSAIELLVEEFYKFSGNTISNQININSVTYEKMVDYIYRNYILVDEIIELVKKHTSFSNVLNLGSSVQKVSNEFSKNHLNKSLKEKESIIIKSCLDNDFLDLPFEKRSAICNDFFKKKLKYIFAVLAIPFIGEVLSAIVRAKTLLDGADRITIPFVIQIIWLKHKYQNRNVSNVIQTQNLLLNELNEPVISLQSLNDDKTSSKEKLDKTNITALNQLLGHIPMTMIKYDTSNKNYAVVNIALDKLTPAKDGNGLRGMLHGYNENGHFGIKENIRLYDTKGLDNFVNTGLLLGFASTVLAQKHLADISQKLDEIKLAIEQVSQFQQNERRAKIESAYQVCHFILGYIQNQNNIPDIEMIKLQNFMTEILAIHEHLKKDLRDVSHKIQNVKFDTMLNRNNSKDLHNLNHNFVEFRKIFQEYCLSSDTIIMINTLLGYMSKNNDKVLYYHDLNTKHLQESKNFMLTINSTIRKHIITIENTSKSITNFDSTDLANRAFFQSRLQELLIQKNFVEQKEEALNSLGNVSVKVLIENGKIIEGELLLN